MAIALKKIKRNEKVQTTPNIKIMNNKETCNNTYLAVYTPTSWNPWDMSQVNHLYRRAAFGIKPADNKRVLNKTPEEAVDALIEEAINMEVTPDPGWGYVGTADLPAGTLALVRQLLNINVIHDMYNNNLRDRMTLFWSNHFVTEWIVVRHAPYVYQYYNCLQRNALGNFKTFVHEIGTNSGMLRYLNGEYNTKDQPNENYARELYELFTLGVDNGYTQKDIEETARALTGWTGGRFYSIPLYFKQEHYDDGEKTIFDQTGNWGYDDVIDILFEQHSEKIAKFICEKLYRYFISPVINEIIVNDLAVTFLKNDFEIAPVISRLLKSKHFFDPASRGVIIKSPLDLCISLQKESNIFYVGSKTDARTNASTIGQQALDPIDVAGWQGDVNWINSNTLIKRWDINTNFINKAYNEDSARFKTFVIDLMGGNSSDVELVARTIMDYFLARPLLDELEYQEGLKSFKGNIPSNYFENGTWSLQYGEIASQVRNLLRFIVRIPEFQLK